VCVLLCFIKLVLGNSYVKLKQIVLNRLQRLFVVEFLKVPVSREYRTYKFNNISLAMRHSRIEEDCFGGSKSIQLKVSLNT